MNEEFILALDQIAEEKGISKDSILEAVEAALAAAYRKDYGKPTEIIKAKIDPDKGGMKFWRVKKVVEEVADENREILLKDAKKEKKTAKLEDEIEYRLPTHDDFGRIAAQTAKQVIVQRLKEAEREVIFNEYKNQEGKMINGVVQQIEGGSVVVDLGKSNGIMFPSEQMTGEHYRPGQRIKVILTQVEDGGRGAQVLVSRAHADLVRYLFMIEVPEIEAGTVEIMGIAREAGTRSKMSVRATQDGVDPVGSCVGQRGTRVQAVLSEIGEEKIDIILWDEDPEAYIANALAPAKIEEIKTDKKAKEAIVYVDPEQLSLAIGKNGQNVRLASKLTEWRIDVLEVGDEDGSKKRGKRVEKETEAGDDKEEVASEDSKEEVIEESKEEKKSKKTTKKDDKEEKPKKKVTKKKEVKKKKEDK